VTERNDFDRYLDWLIDREETGWGREPRKWRLPNDKYFEADVRRRKDLAWEYGGYKTIRRSEEG
jgi:hypothetical protein